MKKSVLVILAVIIVGFLVANGFRGGSGAAAGDWQKNITWQDPAITKAAIAKADKPVYLFVHTEWCTFCKKMIATTFADPKVQELLNDKFIALEINPETSGTTNFLGEKLSYADAATRLGVRGYPASFFFAPDGSLLGGQPGYINAATFGDIAEYIGDGYYRDYSYSEYKALPADKKK
jgi:thioredoxin-related protein